MESPNMPALAEWWRALGVPERDLVRAMRTFNAGAEAFRAAGEEHDRGG
jgi:hypothetical protein